MQEQTEHPYHQYRQAVLRKSNTRRRAVFIAVISLMLIGIAFYIIRPWEGIFDTNATTSHYTENATVITDSTTTASTMATDVLEKVAQLIIVPAEEPVVYQINNVDELIVQQAFFSEAQNGDILLIFPKQGRAIIYSEARNILVNVGPLSYSDTTGTDALNTTAE